MVLSGRQSSHQAWFEVVWTNLEALNFPDKVPQASLNEWWEKAFPQFTLQARLMANLNLDLCSIIEPYLAIRQLQDRPALFTNLLLYALLRKDKEGPLFATFFQQSNANFRALKADQLDYRYYFNWAQIQFTAEEFHLYQVNKQKIRGFSLPQTPSTKAISEAAQVLYVLERALPVLDQPEIPLNVLQLAALAQAREISPDLVPYLPLLLTLFDWTLHRPALPPDAASQLSEWVSLFDSSMHTLQPDFAANLAISCLNRSRSWERTLPNPALLAARNQLNEMLWQKNILPRDAITYFQLLRTQMAAVSIITPRVQSAPDPHRQAAIHPMLNRATEVLEEISRQIAQPHERLQAEQLLQTMILFEQENDEELDQVMKNIQQTKGYLPVFETYSAWVHIKSVFLRNDPSDKLERMISLLQRAIKRKHPKDPYSQFYNGIMHAAEALRQLHRNPQNLDLARKIQENLGSLAEYEDKPWLERLLMHRLS